MTKDNYITEAKRIIADVRSKKLVAELNSDEGQDEDLEAYDKLRSHHEMRASETTGNRRQSHILAHEDYDRAYKLHKNGDTIGALKAAQSGKIHAPDGE